jgi:hypothetical protein
MSSTITRPARRSAVLGLDAVDWFILTIGTALIGFLLLLLA